MRRAASWTMRLGRILVALALLQQGLVPMVHAAMARPVATESGGWVYICTAAGAERIAIENIPGSATAEPRAGGLPQCPLCQGHHPSALPVTVDHCPIPVRVHLPIDDRFVLDESVRPQARPIPLGARAPPASS